MTKLTYNEFDRVLVHIEREFDELLHIDKKKYYNLIPVTSRNQRDILIGFLTVVEAFPEMITRTRFEYELDSNGVPVKRIFKQVSWMDSQQRHWARRFCSEFFIEFDATFNTNSLKMLLFVGVGVININLTFLVAFSFAITESQIASTAFLTFLNEEFWIEGTAPPRVGIIDQGKGMWASFFSSSSSLFASAPSSFASIRKKGGRAKGFKNAPKPKPLLLSTNSPPLSPSLPPASPPVITKSKREMKKKKKIWKQASQEKHKQRQRGATLDVAAAEYGPFRKRSKAELKGVQAEEVEDRKSQQKRIIEFVFLVE